MRKQVPAGGPALFKLVRYWSRRWASPSQAHDASVAHVQVLEAIDAAGVRSSASVSEVATELGLDRSNASRMVQAAVDAGYVAKKAGADDARRVQLSPSKKGAVLLGKARAWQQHAFVELVADWPAADAERFATYLVRLTEQSR